MSTEPRLITLATSDHGPVTLPEPSWCAGHDDHDPETERVDLLHCGPDVVLNFRYAALLTAGILQAPYSTTEIEGLGGPTPGISVQPLGDTLNPAQVYDLAARLDAYADQLRGLADQLATVLDGGSA